MQLTLAINLKKMCKIATIAEGDKKTEKEEKNAIISLQVSLESGGELYIVYIY